MKKLTSILLALVMCLGLCTSVFAVQQPDENGNYIDVSFVEISKTYSLANAGTTSPAETFYLYQDGPGVASESDATEAPALLEDGTIPDTSTKYIASVAYEQGEAGTANATKKFSIDLPTYTKVGVYTYTLKEYAGSTAGVTYRTNAITLKVTVVQQNNGKVRVAAVHTETTDGSKTDSFSDNTYSAAGGENGGLMISKTVTGNMGDQDKYFDVTVKLKGVSGKTYPTTGYVISGGSNENNDTSILVKAGEETSVTLKIKHGETIKIENLPYEVEYSVEEADYTGTNGGYNAASYVVNRGTASTTAVSGQKIDAASETVAITNTKGTDVDTGINMDSVPYIVICGIVVLGAAVVLTKKRFSSED